MKLKKFAKGVFAMAAVAAALIFTGGTSVTAKAAVNTKSDIEIATRLHNYSRSASPIGSYLVDIGNGNMMRVQFDYDSSNIYVEYYDSQYNVTGVRQLAPELPIYGGFYSGSDAYYIVTGQKNEEESDTVECYRITKYDKNWNRIGSAGLYDCNTFLPFRAGCVRMTEADGYLFVPPTELPEITVPAPTLPTPPDRMIVTGDTNQQTSLIGGEVSNNQNDTEQEEIAQITDQQTPKSHGAVEKQWAVLNLIAVMLSLILAIALLLSKRNKEDEDMRTRRRWTKVVAIIIAVVSIVIFVVTENIFLPMKLTDQYTIIMLGLSLIQIVMTIIGRKYKDNGQLKQTVINES